MNKILFAILLIIIFVSSCGVPYYIKKNLTYCYDGHSTGIDTLLNIEGYYSKVDIRSMKKRYTTRGKWLNILDTTYATLMFYDNGIFMGNLWGIDLKNRNIRHKDIQYYFDKLLETKEIVDQSIRIGAYYNGTYRIFGDTIKMQFINYSPTLANTWVAFETWYKIIDKNTIKRIAYKKFYSDNENQEKAKMSLKILDSTENESLTFISIKTRTKPDNWLMKKKWFWCNKYEWKEYRHNLSKGTNGSKKTQLGRICNAFAPIYRKFATCGNKHIACKLIK